MFRVHLWLVQGFFLQIVRLWTTKIELNDLFPVLLFSPWFFFWEPHINHGPNSCSERNSTHWNCRFGAPLLLGKMGKGEGWLTIVILAKVNYDQSAKPHFFIVVVKKSRKPFVRKNCDEANLSCWIMILYSSQQWKVEVTSESPKPLKKVMWS